jgi:hypothetical protein
MAVKDGESGFVEVIENFALEGVEIQIHSFVLRRFARTRITFRNARAGGITAKCPEMGLALFEYFAFLSEMALSHRYTVPHQGNPSRQYLPIGRVQR